MTARIDNYARDEWLVWCRWDTGLYETRGHFVRRIDGRLECTCYEAEPCRHARAVTEEVSIGHE